MSGSRDEWEFWNNIANDKACFDRIPQKHFVFVNENDARFGGYIDDVYKFDPMFFGISFVEAKFMDPQQRKFLELTYKALQKAYYHFEHDDKKIGVYVGVEQNNYRDQFAKGDLNPDIVTGNSMNEVATRVSYTFGFTGPSLSLNTACSSSLVALSLAIQDLKNGHTSHAVVGGVNLNLSDVPFISMRKMNALSKTDSIKPFDEAADGMLLGEAVVSIILKRKNDALKDGNYVYGVVRDIAVNNNGRAQGVTVPTVQGQSEVITEVIGRNPDYLDKIVYIEAHGTGTPLGDPVELASIDKALHSLESDCYIGSYKGNFGHPLAASGLVGVVKALKIFENNMIPKSGNFTKLSHNVNIERKNLEIAERNVSITEGKSYCIGVNAFGFGGTNAHAMLENYHNKPARHIPFPHLINLSHYSQSGLAKCMAILSDVVTVANYSGIIRAVNCSSKQFMYRLSFVARDFQELRQILSKSEMLSLHPAKARTKKLRVCITIGSAIQGSVEHKRILEYFNCLREDMPIEELLTSVCDCVIVAGEEDFDYLADFPTDMTLEDFLVHISRLYLLGGDINMSVVYRNQEFVHSLERSIAFFAKNEYVAMDHIENQIKNRSFFRELNPVSML